MKHTITGYITYEKSAYVTKPTISFQRHKPSKEYFPDRVVIREHSFEVEVDDNYDPRPELINGLKEQMKQARADFEALCTDIKRQISQYEALTMDAAPFIDEVPF